MADPGAPANLDAIVARLADLLGPVDGEVVALDGGITNRNYRVRLGDHDCVVRLCGKDTAPLGIDRATEAIATQRAAQLGIGPRVLARLEDEDVLVCAFLAGASLTPADVRRPENLEAAARMLRTFHDSGALPTPFPVFRLVERQRAHAATTPPGYDDLLAIAHRIEAALAGHPDAEPAPCHNDLLPANLLATPGGLRLVDWEYAGMNDRAFDLGNLAVNNELDRDDEERLLAAYWRPAVVTDRRRAALRLMRFMSDFREAMWGVAQGALSDLDFDYAQYAQEHFARLRATAADPDLEEWMTVAQTA